MDAKRRQGTVTRRQTGRPGRNGRLLETHSPPRPEPGEAGNLRPPTAAQCAVGAFAGASETEASGDGGDGGGGDGGDRGTAGTPGRSGRAEPPFPTVSRRPERGSVGRGRRARASARGTRMRPHPREPVRRRPERTAGSPETRLSQKSEMRRNGRPRSHRTLARPGVPAAHSGTSDGGEPPCQGLAWGPGRAPGRLDVGRGRPPARAHPAVDDHHVLGVAVQPGLLRLADGAHLVQRRRVQLRPAHVQDLQREGALSDPCPGPGPRRPWPDAVSTDHTSLRGQHQAVCSGSSSHGRERKNGRLKSPRETSVPGLSCSSELDGWFYKGLRSR